MQGQSHSELERPSWEGQRGERAAAARAKASTSLLRATQRESERGIVPFEGWDSITRSEGGPDGRLIGKSHGKALQLNNAERGDPFGECL